MSQGYVSVSILDGGSWRGNKAIMHANVLEEPHRMYDWSFYIHHPGLGKHVLWDIGISKVSYGKLGTPSTDQLVRITMTILLASSRLGTNLHKHVECTNLSVRNLPRKEWNIHKSRRLSSGM
jgi:hypothetical protein